ncbi:MAG: hypothetical protein WAS33_29620 [Candidatus Promineifilaceae bacterium]
MVLVFGENGRLAKWVRPFTQFTLFPKKPIFLYNPNPQETDSKRG